MNSAIEKRQKKMELKMLKQARRAILAEIDRLEVERCEKCAGPVGNQSNRSEVANCDCAAAVRIRELGSILSQDNAVIKKEVFKEPAVPVVPPDEIITVEKYQEMKASGLRDQDIMKAIGWHTAKFYAWKRENKILKKSMEGNRVVKEKEEVDTLIIAKEEFSTVSPDSTFKGIILDTVGLLIDKQTEKGVIKYGQSLEACDPSAFNWNVMIQEELIDALQYQQKEIFRLTAEKSLSLNAYLVQSNRTAEPHENELLNYGLGISEEAGEVSGLIKKSFFHGHDINRNEIMKELGDVLWYLSQIARLAGLTLEEVATANIEKLQKRYPNGFSESDSIHRAE